MHYAICMMSYALRPLHGALCLTPYTLCCMPDAVCSMLYASQYNTRRCSRSAYLDMCDRSKLLSSVTSRPPSHLVPSPRPHLSSLYLSSSPLLLTTPHPHHFPSQAQPPSPRISKTTLYHSTNQSKSPYFQITIQSSARSSTNHILILSHINCQ